jgi:hypothetical protein
MGKTQKPYLLLTLLLCYAAGRILQLFAGKVPNLLIVVLTVIPPRAFRLDPWNAYLPFSSNTRFYGFDARHTIEKAGAVIVSPAPASN